MKNSKYLWNEFLLILSLTVKLYIYIYFFIFRLSKHELNLKENLTEYIFSRVNNGQPPFYICFSTAPPILQNWCTTFLLGPPSISTKSAIFSDALSLWENTDAFALLFLDKELWFINVICHPFSVDRRKDKNFFKRHLFTATDTW